MTRQRHLDCKNALKPYERSSMQYNLYADAPVKRNPCRSFTRKRMKRTLKPVLPATWRFSFAEKRRSDVLARFIDSLLRPAFRTLVTRLDPIGRAANMFPLDCIGGLLVAGWRSDGLLFHDGDAWQPDFPPTMMPVAASGPRELLVIATVSERMELRP